MTGKKKKTEPKKPTPEKPKVHPKLDGLNIHINQFGEIIPNYDISKINTFLNEEVEDKKLKDRTDLAEKKPLKADEDEEE